MAKISPKCQLGLIGIGLALGIILLVGGSVLGWVVAPRVMKHMITLSTRLVRDNDMWKMWSDVPLPIQFRIYFFNVTNPDCFIKGDRVILDEIGPYVYREKKQKVELKEVGDSLLSFKDRMFLYFDAEASHPRTENDIISLPNLPMITIAHVATANKMDMAKMLMGQVMGEGAEGIVKTNVTVREVLFDGWKLPDAFTMIPPDMRPPELEGNKFGLFRFRNGTPQTEFVIESGRTGDYEHLGQVRVFGGKTEMDVWYSEGLPHDSPRHYCNKINGSDGTIFAPFIKKDRLYVFQPLLCRSLYVTFDGEEKHLGIPAYKFSLPPETFADPSVNPNNNCYCKRQSPDLAHWCASGFLRLHPCAKGAPMVYSNVHFLDGDPELWKAVNIAPPNKEEHGMYMLIEPTIGAPLKGVLRSQLNIEIQKIPGYKLFEDIDLSKTTQNPSLIHPVVRIEEIVEMDEEHAAPLRNMLVHGGRGVIAARWIAVIVGALLTVASAGYFAFTRIRASKS